MKKTAIVTGGTKDQFPAMATLALNLAEVSPNVADEFVFFHDGVPEKEIERLRKAVEGVFTVRDILYKSPFLETKDFTDEVTKYFSIMVFCRVDCFKLLSDYATVIWLDYDVYVKKDISDLRVHGNNYAKFMMSPVLATKFNIKLFWEFQDELNTFDPIGPGISGGMWVLHDDFPDFMGFYNDCIECTRHFAKALYTAEEGPIGMTIQRRKIEYEHLNLEKYVIHPTHNTQEEIDAASIIHAVGQPKFWNGLDYAPWQKYYDMWQKKYGGEKIFVKKEYKMPVIVKILRCFLPYGFIVLYNKLKKIKDNVS